MTRQMTGAKMVVQALKDQGVDTVFGYPGGAALPIYDEIFQQNDIRHILVRHEQGAVHAAEGYARSTGKVGVVLVTSGPGVTNTVTGLTDALLDSIPILVISAQVPTFMIGTDAFQEADTVGITRPCTKHNWLVKDTDKVAETLHQAFHVATAGRPGPVLVDIPKDVQFASGAYIAPRQANTSGYKPQMKGDIEAIRSLVAAIEVAKRPLFYTGGGVINSGPHASALLRELVDATGIPITSTLMGLGAYPASGKNWLGMLGMHGLYEANMAMHDCDLMINLGARFDDRITGKLDAFSPGSTKAHVDIDASSINKVIHVDIPILGDIAHVLEDLLRLWKSQGRKTDKAGLAGWWAQIGDWQKKNCLDYAPSTKTIKPQYALQRLEALTKDHDRYITTEVGQHQMWAAQFFKFDQPNRWMTSGGLGTMGYGMPAALGVQRAHPDALVIDIAGEASILMNIQELSCIAQYNLPVKVFIVNNQWMGMVRQWQELLHGGRYSESYTASLPDFVKLAESFHAVGIRCEKADDLDDKIMEMIETPKPVIFDCLVSKDENCFPMIPSGAAHYEMLLGPEDKAGKPISEEGMVLV